MPDPDPGPDPKIFIIIVAAPPGPVTVLPPLRVPSSPPRPRWDTGRAGGASKDGSFFIVMVMILFIVDIAAHVPEVDLGRHL